MSRFYISQIAASGDAVDYSSVTLNDGVNFIVGPSNTGKSYVISCIDFMLGGKEPPFSRASTGYDTIHMVMKSDDGYQLLFKRKIEDGKTGDKGSNNVSVTSSFPNIADGEYKIQSKEYSDILLQLMGIEKRPQIIANQNAGTDDLTFRTISHFFFINEDHIFQKETPFDIPGYSKITSCLTSLIFLLTGDDLKKYVPEVSADELEKRATQKAGVILYLNGKINALTERKKILEKELAADTGIDVESKIDSLVSEIEAVEKEIVEATEQSRQLLAEIYSISEKLQEARYLSDRYGALRSQYISDIKRLQFIADASKKGAGITHKPNCPFCGHDMDAQEPRQVYVDSAEKELIRIKKQLEDLESAQAETAGEISLLESRLSSLNIQNNNVTNLLNKSLRPKAHELRSSVSEYERILRLRQELESVSYMSTTLSVDVFEKENEEDVKPQKISARELFDKDLWQELSSGFDSMIKACAYPGKPDSYLSIDTVDAVVGGKHKKEEGKGYRAFINTIMLFNLMKHLEAKGTYAPRFLILDSPILSLKERKYEISEEEVATPGMKESLIRYIINNCGDNQIIIAENELPETINYDKVNLITFAQTEEDGQRYGFLRSTIQQTNA